MSEYITTADIMHGLGFDDDETNTIRDFAEELGEDLPEFVIGAIRRRAGL